MNKGLESEKTKKAKHELHKTFGEELFLLWVYC